VFKVRVLQGEASLLSRDRIEQVQSIFRQIFPALADYADGIPSLVRNPLKHGYRSVLLVVERALGRVDAFALVMHFHDVRSSYLDFIATRPGIRGSGVGSALYEAARELCINAGSKGLYMEVQPDTEELTPDPVRLDQARKRIRFYEQYGVSVVENAAYSAPVGTPPTTAFLLFDGLGRTDPLGREEAARGVEKILTLRYGQTVDRGYVRRVLRAFQDDPVRLRPLQYVKSAKEQVTVKKPRLSQALALVSGTRHEIHHVRERGYFERPVRVKAIHESLDPSGLFASVRHREHGVKHILAVHEAGFVNYLRTVCTRVKEKRPVYPDTFPIRRPDPRPKELPVQAGYYCIDTGTPLYRNAFIAARSAVDVALTAAEEILSGKQIAYAVCRPPGHHAGKRFYGGFCYFNNAAIAAQYLCAEVKVAVFDIDFHHGNGTQDIFYERGDVLTVSIHGHPDYSYPYFSGHKDETGQGNGLGFNVNIPLPPKTADEDYFRAFNRAVRRIVDFKPEVLVVSLGYDILKGDPTGTFLLTPGTMRAMGAILSGIGKPLLIVQEGGYSIRNIRRGSHQFFTGVTEGINNTV
jgi:acetoin utilization deacetylase AcuC-like enzyme/GNAT superfamily N-acetyltransferase